CVLKSEREKREREKGICSREGYVSAMLRFVPLRQTEKETKKKEHQSHICQVLQWLLENGLYIKREKCEFHTFHASRASFLGFIIERGQVQADPEKVRALAEWPIPTSRKLLRFLSFVKFYRSFTRNYSQVAAPLTALTLPARPFQQSPDADCVFNQLKRLFTSAPVLAQPDPASVCGRSGCVRCRSGILSQRQGPEACLHLCAFFSWRLTPAEADYDVGNQELLAIKLVLEEWRQPVHTRTVRRWTQEAAEGTAGLLRVNRLGCTLPGLCTASPNNKPWITRDLKALLNKKKRAFRAGDREEQRRVQHELRDMLRTCKDNYRRKLEAKLQQNNVRDVWTGMKHITGDEGERQADASGSLDRANQFNQFFNRFSSPLPAPLRHLRPPTHPHCSQMARPTPSILLYSTSLSAPPPSPPHPSPSSNIRINPCPTVTTGQVKRQLERLHQRKAAGPDGITPRILKTCASQLSPVLGHLYNLSLSQEKVPMLWKTSCLGSGPQEVEAIRPGRLQTSCPHISCDEGPGETGLSPAEATVPFNTIQPLLLGEKLQVVMGVDDSMISWITDYLTGRPQFVRLGSVLSDVVVSDTGAPQGTVLSPFLFTLYTTDFQYNSESCHLQKFSDDSAVVGCIREGEEGEYRTLVDNFVEWSEQNHLRLNVNKTREMVIDFRRKKMPSTATTDQGGGGGRGGGLQIPGSGDRQQTGLEI
ncbi:hypothetical protein L3Q82_017181, partial [Scortum barcoo]